MKKLKISGADHGLEELRRELGQQFARSRRRAQGDQGEQNPPA